MAKKKQQLPDLTKQDVLTPLDISQLGTNGDQPLRRQYTGIGEI